MVRHVDDNRVAVQAVDMLALVTLPTEFRSQGARMIIGIRTPASKFVIFLSQNNHCWHSWKDATQQ